MHKVTPWWEMALLPEWLRRLFQNPQRILSGLVQPGMTVADIGCGLGFFSLSLAEIVGKSGRVICVDMQQEMLDILQKRAARKGLLDRIDCRRCEADDLQLAEPVEFVLMMWMSHEVADRRRLFQQIRAIIKPGGHWLLVEPIIHVPSQEFSAIRADALSTGLQVRPAPHVSFSRGVLLASAP
jgi:ubiquinone/menaquinone biosynthesis C-methylase UbiE